MIPNLQSVYQFALITAIRQQQLADIQSTYQHKQTFTCNGMYSIFRDSSIGSIITYSMFKAGSGPKMSETEL